ncbi:MAG: Zn-dependent alcohol dehydrogenase [Mycobacterium sp.]|nr:Zn-dependent alcohol dehydrogenase [Mycobacterium sp.]
MSLKIASMRAVRHTASGITVEQVPDVAGNALDGMVVQVISSGICGSDLHMLEWGAMPFTLGHEIGGRLDDGTPVTVWPLVPCETCDRCVAGEPQQCRTGTSRIYGVGPEGGMADRILVDPRNVVPLPNGLAPSDACLVEPIACSVHALRRAGTTKADRVAVIGAGSIGLGATAAARFLGCSVDVAARHERQKSAATAMGAGLDPSGEYDVVIDAAGTSTSIAKCIEVLRPGGTLVIVSSQWQPIEFPMFFASKEPILVTATMHGPGSGSGEDSATTDMQEAARLLADMPEVAPAMITHRFPLDDAAKAFAAAADRSAGAIKVALEP